MAYGKNINALAEERLLQRRNNALANQEKQKSEIYSKIPRLQEIEEELSSIGAKAAKAVIQKNNAKEVAQELAKTSLALQREAKTILFQNGYTDQALEAHFVCSKCNDTGRYDDETGKTVICSCLKKLRTQIACEELNKISPLSLSTFESFNLDYYDMDIYEGYTTSAYDRMSKIFEYCKKYADRFSLNMPGILMKGATGLGKTHLSLAIANEVIKKGFGVIYVSAPMILSKLEKKHFSYAYDEEESMMNVLTECDLLIIDDLGTEFQTGYSSSTVYNIFNSRLLNGKPTIINTNLTLKEMEATYTPRFVSRIMGNCSKLDFLGSDIRKPKKR